MHDIPCLGQWCQAQIAESFQVSNRTSSLVGDQVCDGYDQFAVTLRPALIHRDCEQRISSLKLSTPGGEMWEKHRLALRRLGACGKSVASDSMEDDWYKEDRNQSEDHK